MVTISTRVSAVRKALGLSQQALGDRLGYSRNYINQIETGKKDPGKGFERSLVILESEVRTQSTMGVEKATSRVQEERSGYVVDKKSFHFDAIPLRSIPVISWAQAGKLTEFEELPDSMQHTIPSACGDAKAFALMIKGDSMEPKFSEGDIAVVMPGEYPHNGCLVIARVKQEGVVFKIFSTPQDNVIELRSYNHQLYPPIRRTREDFHWIYPVHSVTKNVWR